MVLQWGTRPTKEERDFEGGKDETEAGAADKKEKPKESSGSMVVSGGGKNLEKLEGHPAILDVPAGKGRVIAFNFSPLHRDLNRSDQRFLWNAILNWSGLPPNSP
jgi:hypothetical protein